MTSKTPLYPIWVSRLVFPFRYGKLISGLLIFIVMWGLLILGSGASDIGFFAELFFAAMCAYLIPVFTLIVERSVKTFDKIESALDATPEERELWRRQLTHRSMRWLLLITAFALIMGVCNIIVSHPAQGSGLIDEMMSSRGVFSKYIFTLFIWLTMATAIGALIGNALLFGRLGYRMRIDLLRTRTLLDIAQVAIMSTLSVIGAQVLFVLLLFDSGVTLLEMLPGFITTLLPVLLLFLLPVWPLHHRLQHAKRDELEKIDVQLARARPLTVTALDDGVSLDKVNRLLLYRREIQQVSEWPFDMPAITRLGLYLILPPLTWIGAALIENVVDKLL